MKHWLPVFMADKSFSIIIQLSIGQLVYYTAYARCSLLTKAYRLEHEADFRLIIEWLMKS